MFASLWRLRGFIHPYRYRWIVGILAFGLARFFESMVPFLTAISINRMTEGNFVPGGLSKFQLKDLNNVLAEAQALGLELPAAEQVRERFAHFCEHMNGADQDHSGLYLELRARNHLPGADK